MEAHSPKTKENPLAALVSTNTFLLSQLPVTVIHVLKVLAVRVID